MTNKIRNFLYGICPRSFRHYWDKIDLSPIGSRLARGVFWSMAGSVISRGLMLCATILVARILGKTGFGELGMVQSTVGMFGIFAGFGLGLTATKHIAEFCERDPERAGRVLGLSGLIAMFAGGIIAIVVLIFAPWLAEHTINAPHLGGVLRIGALILFINSLNGAQTGALSGFQAFKTIAYVNLAVGLFSFPILVCGAYFWGLGGAVWGMALNLCFNWLFNHIALRKEARRYKVPFTFKDCRQELPIIWHFALPATLSGMLVGPSNWVIRAMLTSKSGGYDEIGILTATLVFQNLILFVSSTLGGPLLSMVSNAGEKISDRFETVNVLSTWILGVFVAIPLLCFPEIAEIVFGSDYSTHSFRITFSLVIFCTSIMTFKSGLARVLAARSLLWFGFLSNFFWSSILISSSYFLVRWGAFGLAAALTFAYILNTVVLLPLYYFRNLIPRKTLVSFESGIIWLTLGGLVFLNIADVPLIYRIVAFVPCLLLVGLAFKRIAIPKNCRINR